MALVSYSDSSVTSDDEDEDETLPPVKRHKRSSSPQWIRNFPHVDGNWPSYVYFRVPMTAAMQAMTKFAMERVQRHASTILNLVPIDTDEENALHLSLSRTFVLKYAQIQPFVQALRLAVKYRKSFRAGFQGHQVLINDEQTRLFVTVPVLSGKVDVCHVIRCVDVAMAQFNLQEYYSDPIPHVSVAASTTIMPTLRESPNDREADNVPPCAYVDLTHIHATIGNKHFSIPLLS
ncbi:hypothetical protein LEN26_006492 [Aphanomyces euteiches]|nr:hypothetical protein LEN26_006492 [Aphanomyces euteiches]